MFTRISEHVSSASANVGISGWAVRSSSKEWSARMPYSSSCGSWWTTSTPSEVRRTSNSTPSAPNSWARTKAASVFSGAWCEAPRCANTSGRYDIDVSLRNARIGTRSTNRRESPDQTPCRLPKAPVTCDLLCDGAGGELRRSGAQVFGTAQCERDCDCATHEGRRQRGVDLDSNPRLGCG